MAFAITQDFNDLTDGDLTGQSGGSGFSAAWSGDVEFDILGTETPQEGAKHVKVVNNADVDKTISRTLTTATLVGAFNIYGRIKLDTGSTVRWRTEIFNGATELGEVFVYPDAGFTRIERLYWNGTTNVYDVISSGTLALNTYFKLTFEVDNTNQAGKYRVTVNDGTPSAWQQFEGGASIGTGIDKIRLAHGGNNGNGTGMVYFDSISSAADAVNTGNMFLMF